MKKGFLIEWRNGRQVASVDLREKINLAGKHNHQNICAAYASCRSLGIAPKKIAAALSTFKGLPHRMQILGRKNGVLFVNDSKATNCASASKALESFKNVHWIVGGKEKEEGIESLMPINKNVKGILINIFGGIMRCDVLAQGVVDAAKEIKINIPLVVRLAGTNYIEGKKILDNSGLKLISAENLDDAAKKIVEAIK